MATPRQSPPSKTAFNNVLKHPFIEQHLANEHLQLKQNAQKFLQKVYTCSITPQTGDGNMVVFGTASGDIYITNMNYKKQEFVRVMRNQSILIFISQFCIATAHTSSIYSLEFVSIDSKTLLVSYVCQNLLMANTFAL